jgi:hypothetical protein
VRVLGLLVLSAVGCVREPLPAGCPDVDVGDLVLTEFRGPQSPEDPAGGIWVELYNASSATIDLHGIKIRFRTKTGSSEVPVLVRRSVTVNAGAYVVLGLFADALRPAHVDYGFADDFTRTFLPAAAVDVESCGRRIERATYDVLPRTGTHSLGTDPPDALNNDVPAMWCTNPTPEGTPRQPNPACP